MSNLKARGTKVVALSNRSLNKSGALPFPLQGFMCLSTSPCEPRGSWPKSNISSNRKENKKHCQSRKGHQQNPEQAIENLEGIVRRHCLQYLAMLHLSVHVLSTMQKTNWKVGSATTRHPCLPNLSGDRFSSSLYIGNTHILGPSRCQVCLCSVHQAVDTVVFITFAALWLTLKA